MRRGLLGVALAAALAGCGGGGGGDHPSSDPLVWSGAPTGFRARTLPHDRVVFGRLRNDSSKTLYLDARRVLVRDARGRILSSSARFNQAYAHGLYGILQQPHPLPPGELTRLGITTAIVPGHSVPFFVAYRLRRGSREPAHLVTGAGTLVLPRATRVTAR